jgi:UDP-galactopyranose mutase
MAIKKEYDYLIVGSGLFGAVFAYEMTSIGKKCLVIDKRNHTGGNIHCRQVEGINVHSYGAHIFHTDDMNIWNYVNNFVPFNNYINSPLANYHGELYNLPFNMNTFYRLWGTVTPDQARAKILEQTAQFAAIRPSNLEEQAIKLVGTEIYEKFIRHYTSKQWGRPPCELPASIIRRIPIRFTFNNNYFNDRYQGIPIGGYNAMTEKMLRGAEVRINTDFFRDRSYFESLAEKTVFSGRLDEYFGYCFGDLEYRSLRFETESLDTDNFQGNAVVNFTDEKTPYTRICEHKHFEFGTQPTTVITREYPIASARTREPYYPINDVKNMQILDRYKTLKDREQNVIFGGRLAEYRYYDMHQVIASALHTAMKEFRLLSINKNIHPLKQLINA